MDENLKIELKKTLNAINTHIEDQKKGLKRRNLLNIMQAITILILSAILVLQIANII